MQIQSVANESVWRNLYSPTLDDSLCAALNSILGIFRNKKPKTKDESALQESQLKLVEKMLEKMTEEKWCCTESYSIESTSIESTSIVSTSIQSTSIESTNSSSETSSSNECKNSSSDTSTSTSKELIFQSIEMLKNNGKFSRPIKKSKKVKINLVNVIDKNINTYIFQTHSKRLKLHIRSPLGQ